LTTYEKVKILCKKKGMSVRQLEIKAGLSTGSISKWDKCCPIATKLKAVTDVLGCTMEELL
jgi:lambda repressor-like predicted transcriptional regulator